MVKPMPIALIIDDDPLNLRVLSSMLNRHDYDVTTSERGDHGIDLAIQLQPDLILLDLLMPQPTYDGVEVIKRLRALPDFQLTPIVAVSAADTHTMKKMINDNLFTDFMQKPITLDILAELFTRLKDHKLA